jgi:hypothetical protein
VWILSFIPLESQQLFCAGKRAGGFIEKRLAIFYDLVYLIGVIHYISSIAVGIP